jgi:chromosomal replication initiation ATPase DnaA
MNKAFAIMLIVSQVTGVSIEAIRGKSRIPPIKIARQLVHYYVYKYTESVSKTGNITLNNHATVYNSVTRVEDWGHYEDYSCHIEGIENMLEKVSL